jgi:phage FluMu protein Com
MAKSFKFQAMCPHCEDINHFHVTQEEVDNDYDFSCDNKKCQKQSPLSRWIVEPATKR